MNPVAKIKPTDNPQSVPESFWTETKTIGGIKCHRHPNGGGFDGSNPPSQLNSKQFN